MTRRATRDLFRFAVVGSLGFIVDAGVMFVLIELGVNAYVARLASFPAAVICTWWFNRIWTFDGAERARPGAQFNRYLAVQLTGAVANYVVYAFVLRLIGTTSMDALIALAFGSAVGLVINYLGSKRFVFLGPDR